MNLHSKNIINAKKKINDKKNTNTNSKYGFME